MATKKTGTTKKSKTPKKNKTAKKTQRIGRYEALGKKLITASDRIAAVAEKLMDEGDPVGKALYTPYRAVNRVASKLFNRK